MRVVSLVSQKGGSGKSSLVISLAVAAQERGLKVYIVDLDPQATAKNWFDRRESSWPEVAAVEAPKLPLALAALKGQGIDLILVDTAGVDTPATTAAMSASDLCLIPARPSVADIEASRATVQTLNKLGRPFAFVLNQTPAGRSIRTSDAYRVLRLGAVVAPPTLAMRADHLDALAMGHGVTEWDPTGKAAQEIRALLSWVVRKLEGTEDAQETCVA